MDDSLISKIRQDFDRIALHAQSGWDHNNHYHRFLLNHLPGQRGSALEIGCGTGEFSRLLATRFAAVTAIDLSANMIEVAKQISAQGMGQSSGQFSNIDFQVADILQQELPSQKFDLIASIATFHHLPLDRLLPTVKAALNPGGKLVVLDLLDPESWLDQCSDLIAVPLNWLFQTVKNRHLRYSPEAAAALKAHLSTDRYLTLSQARHIYTSCLGNVKLRKHLFWRYSVVWEKPRLPSDNWGSP